MIENLLELNFNKTADAIVLDIHDGDTITVAILVEKTRRKKDKDLGYHIHIENGWITLHTAVRFYGINAPELATPEGVAALNFLKQYVAVGDTVQVETALNPTDKYGRWIGKIHNRGVILNDIMEKSGHAISYLV